MSSARDRAAIALAHPWPRWALVRPAPLWCFLLGVAVAIVFASFADSRPVQFVVAGITLELLGIYVVGAGFVRLGEFYGAPTIRRRAATWWRERPRRRRIVELAGRAAGHVSIEASAGAVFEARVQELPLAERVDRLERQVSNLASLQSRIERDSERRDRELRTEIAGARRAAEEGDKQIRESLREDRLGDFDTQVVGLVWVALGLILTSAAGLI